MYDFLFLVASTISWSVVPSGLGTWFSDMDDSFYSSVHKVTQSGSSIVTFDTMSVNRTFGYLVIAQENNSLHLRFYSFLELAVLLRLQPLDLTKFHQLMLRNEFGEI
jgi:hypothetical protein